MTDRDTIVVKDGGSKIGVILGITQLKSLAPNPS
jgi:hypothetical protein